jgi:phosphate ABC transporter phosphate-binding protein
MAAIMGTALPAPLRSRLGKSIPSRAREQAVLVLICFATLPAVAWQPKHGKVDRLYVEAFVTKSPTDTFQKDVTAELRKISSISLAPNESGADLILGGGGEIWVKGYRPFSPRSEMRLPTNGTPVYGGYVAVELRNKQGVTLWSDLVTPGPSSEDAAKDLARLIAKHVAHALEMGQTLPITESLPQAMVALKGAGATFPYPVYSKWFANYRRQNMEVEITYDPVGSEAGVRKLLAGEVDFGAADSREAIHDIAPGEESKYFLLPSVVGAVVPIVNLPGLPGEISFTSEALAGIFLGKIKKWNDPVLKKINPRVDLPDLDIVVIHRAEGSGTSYAWTDYLSKTSQEWKSAVGAGLDPKWPTGRAAAGNDGVAKLVKELGGSIGYVEYIYALQNHLNYGKVRNRNGEFVEASLESIAAAVSHGAQNRDDLNMSIVDAPGAGSYPIATFTWLIVPVHVPDDAKRTAIASFLRWTLGPGQRQAAALGYLALPKEIVGMEADAIAMMH